MKFDLQPTLKGELITLRPLKRDDFESLYKAASDPLIWELHPDRYRYQRDVYKKYFDGGLASGGGFVILDNSTNEIIGSSRYYDLDEEKNQIIIGYTFLTRKYWGGKYNKELKKLMIDHAFKFVDAVLFEIGTENLRSRRAIEKIGAKLVETRNLDIGKHAVYKIERESYVLS